MQARNSFDLSSLERARHALDRAQSFNELKAIRDFADSAARDARLARLGVKRYNQAAALKLRAERKAGSYLASLRLRGGDRRSASRPSGPTLADLGVSRAQSRRWQQLASIAEQVFVEYVEVMNTESRAITTAGFLRLAGKAPTVVPHAHPLTKSDCRFLSDGESLRDDTLDDLANHARLLQQVLRPIFEMGDFQLSYAERRVVGCLLSEVNSILRARTAKR